LADADGVEQRYRRWDAEDYLIAGRANDPRFAARLVARIEADPELSASVRLIGRQSRERMRLLYRLAEIAVVPSVFEAFPYAALEAIGAQVPVVATDTGGLGEIVRATGGGLLVPLQTRADGSRHADVGRLASAQIQLLEDPGLRARLAVEGRTRAAEQFTVDRMVDGTLSVYRAAVSSAVRAQQIM
jgi:glycosyltransferase involved in cell wall biosynthesis